MIPCTYTELSKSALCACSKALFHCDAHILKQIINDSVVLEEIDLAKSTDLSFNPCHAE